MIVRRRERIISQSGPGLGVPMNTALSTTGRPRVQTGFMLYGAKN